MYRITPVKSTFGTLWVSLLALTLAAAAIAVQVWLIRFGPRGQNDGWMVTLIMLSFYFAIICICVAIASSGVRIENYRNGREVIFDDHLTIHYPWPVKSRIYAWSEIARIQAIDQKVVMHEPVFWAPLPLSGIVPGADVVFQINLHEKRIQSVRKFRILHVDGRRLADVSGDENFTIVRWLSRKTINDCVAGLGGEIIWNNDSPQLLLLKGSRVSAEQWECLKEQVANIPGLEEIDVSGTALGDEALRGLEEYPTLRKVQARGSRISPEALAQLIAALARRNSQGKFDFLAQ